MKTCIWLYWQYFWHIGPGFRDPFKRKSEVPRKGFGVIRGRERVAAMII